MSRPLGICKQQQIFFVMSCRYFRRHSEVKGFKHRHFGIRKAFIDHKRPIKPCSLSFFSCFMQFLLSLNQQLCLQVYKKVATNIFAYWSDGLGGRKFDHHNRKGGGAFANENCPLGWVIDSYFKCSVFVRGEGVLAARIDSPLYSKTMYIKDFSYVFICRKLSS